MTVYSRSDRTSIGGVPGCDQTHDLPIDPETGQRYLTCPAHEAWIKGDRKPKILVHKIQDGRVVSQERVADMEPGWSTTPDTVPLTPDEERADKHFRETAQTQINLMNALGSAVNNNLEIPREMMRFLKRGLPAETLRALQGSVVCANGHDVEAGKKFCGECGISMAAKGAIGRGGGEDLGQVHVARLKKMARDRGLSDAGSKADVIQRLQAA